MMKIMMVVVVMMAITIMMMVMMAVVRHWDKLWELARQVINSDEGLPAWITSPPCVNMGRKRDQQKDKYNFKDKDKYND